MVEQKQKRLQLLQLQMYKCCTSKKTIVQYFQDINKSQKLALIKKFQLVHFLTVHNKAFNLYQELAHFGKDYHNVQLVSGYLSKDVAQEALQYISNSILEEKVTLPLNSGKTLLS